MMALECHPHKIQLSVFFLKANIAFDFISSSIHSYQLQMLYEIFSIFNFLLLLLLIYHFQFTFVKIYRGNLESNGSDIFRFFLC